MSIATFTSSKLEALKAVSDRFRNYLKKSSVKVGDYGSLLLPRQAVWPLTFTLSPSSSL